ncbi:MAG: NADH:flavin oxidoreductase [Chloroflexi bacterium]|nr:MAG: NADH:flavin oxidoreductase [Chloroflexota bacterium]
MGIPFSILRWASGLRWPERTEGVAKVVEKKAGGKVFSPGRIGKLELRNRIIRAGCFEGMCPDGCVSEELIEHHRAVAAGGAAMTTVAYCSVAQDGRAYGHEMWMRKEIIPDLKRLTDAVHAEGAAASIQLGHCGYFASRRTIGHAPLGASRKFCLFRLSFPRVMNEHDMANVREQFAQAATMAMEAGFDAIEVHAGHGYLLSQFLSPYTNKRKDEYGGPLENRMRFPASVIRRVREAVGPDYPVLVKMNTTDGIRGALEVDDAVEVARRFEAEGASALVPSCGFTAKTPLMMLRGGVPTWMMAWNQTNPLQIIGLLLFGRFMVQEYKFEELFLLENARKVRQAVNIPVVLIGGVCSVDNMETAMNEGFEFVEVGRAIIRDPDIVNKMQRGEVLASDCDHCNRCVAAMDKGGVRCVALTKGLKPRKK